MAFDLLQGWTTSPERSSRVYDADVPERKLFAENCIQPIFHPVSSVACICMHNENDD